MMARQLVAASMALAALAVPAYAQDAENVTYRLRVAEEVTMSRWDELSRSTHLFAASGESSLAWKDRVRFGAAFGLLAGSDEVRVRTREAYARWSALPWMDIEAGRRLVRWGTGYGFTPTGVLDPARDPSDPQDRLGMNEGVLMVKADAYAGPASVTMVASERRHAARVRTTARGVEMALIAAVDRAAAPAWGANFTHVIGDRLEWHGEVLARGEPGTRRRATSALIGGQYTIASAANVVLEYHRAQGAGFLFARISRGQGDLVFSPDVIVIHGIDTGETSVVPTVALVIGERAQLYARGAFANSLSRRAVTAGMALRF
jgi:hypothetical protein